MKLSSRRDRLRESKKLLKETRWVLDQWEEVVKLPGLKKAVRARIRILTAQLRVAELVLAHYIEVHQ